MLLLQSGHWKRVSHNSQVKYIVLYLLVYPFITGPASPPGNVTTVALSPTFIMVTWEEIPAFDQNGIIIAYEVVYEPLDTFSGELEAEAMNTTDTLTTLRDLEEFVGYNVTVRAYTSAGPGPYSDIITDMTLEDGKNVDFVCKSC